MSSLPERIEVLGKDLLANPLRISAYHDLPFAILYYDPASEFEVRKQTRLFATRLQNAGKRVHVISIAGILWTAIRDTEGIEAIAEEEKQFGFARTQETVATLVSDDAFMPLPDQIEQRMQGMEPTVDVVFLVRVAALGPQPFTARQSCWTPCMAARWCQSFCSIQAHSTVKAVCDSWTCRNANRLGLTTIG